MTMGAIEILLVIAVVVIPLVMALVILVTLFFVKRGRKGAEAQSRMPAARLAGLEEARLQNLITEEEYQRKRAEIVEGI